MIKIYAVLVKRDAMDDISATPYNFVAGFDGYVYLEQTTKENAGDFVYYLLNEIDYQELAFYQNCVVALTVNEIRKSKQLIK